MNVVVFQGSVEGAGERSVQYGGCQGEAEDKDAADGADDGGGERTHTAEEGANTDNDFGNGGDDGHNVGDIHPFGHGLVSLQPILELFAEELISDGVVQMPDINRIEPELLLPVGAVCHVLVPAAGAVLLVVTCAIVPKTNVVEVLDASSFGGYVSSLVD